MGQADEKAHLDHLGLPSIQPGEILERVVEGDQLRVPRLGEADILGNVDASATRIFYGIISDQTISRIRTIEVENDGDGIVSDDIQFSPQSTLIADGFESDKLTC